MKLTRDPNNKLMLIYVQNARTIKLYHIEDKTHQFVGSMPDAILAMHCCVNVLRPVEH